MPRHCEGKDRAGFAAMMPEMLMGWSESEILIRKAAEAGLWQIAEIPAEVRKRGYRGIMDSACRYRLDEQ